MNTAHQPGCASKGGRPVTTGETKTRTAGRIGQIWDDCADRAKADGETMTDFVTTAITNELRLRRQRDARKSAAPRRASLKAGPS
jgi:hypothetical protein